MRGLEARQGLSPRRGHSLAQCPPLQPGDVAPLPSEQQDGAGQGLPSCQWLCSAKGSGAQVTALSSPCSPTQTRCSIRP